jgi:oligopeptidase B
MTNSPHAEKDAGSAVQSALSATGTEAIEPPVARRHPVEHIIHGDRRIDEYAWLRDKNDPAVIDYLNAENAYTDAVLRSTEPFQERLYQEMLGRILQTDLSVPYRLRGYDYFTRTEEGKQYPLHGRKRAATSEVDPTLAARSAPHVADAPEEVLLDLNALAEGHSFLGLGIFDISDDNELLAYATDVTGFRQYTLQVKNLRTGETLPQRIERATSTAWAADNRTLFYTVEDETTKRSYQLYRHVLGANEPDALLLEEKDERFRIEIERSSSGGFLILTSASHTASEVRFLAAANPMGGFALIAAREDEHEYYVEHHPRGERLSTGGVFFILTNSRGRTFRLVQASTANPDRENWREVIPNRPHVMLNGIEVFATHLAILEREDGLPHLRIVALPADWAPNSGAALTGDFVRPSSVPAPELLAHSHRLEFSEPAYNVVFGANPEFTATHVRFVYESFITPRSVYDYDFGNRERHLRKQQPVLGGYDSTHYASERLHAKAPDGTAIPISIAYRRDTPRDASAPLLLYGYGSYGLSMPIGFNSNRLSLLDRGVVFAIAHIRGGGELGKPWHDAGRLDKKRNTFTDFIAAAEHLIAERFTNPQRLVIEGGSAGGLLMGAVTNMRPDLFRIVISHVPFVDVLNTMLDASLPLTIGEYEEWGNPQISSDYFYMKSYCPYTNLAAHEYPITLLKAGLHDSQVMYWEPAKYVARLRTLKTDQRPLLLKTNMGAGHGGASGRYDYLREIALDYAFLLTQLGIPA